MARHYLVTGGCGFIGSHLVDALLAAGHQVTVLDDLSSGRRGNLPAGARLIVGDVADPKAVADAMAGTDGCFHLAAVVEVQRTAENWASTHRINLGGAVNCLEAARRLGADRPVPVVMTSSAAVYGLATDMPLAEDVPTRPISPYGADKLGAEIHGHVGAATMGSRATALRLFNVFGPRQLPASPYSGVVSIFVRQALAGEALTVVGDGEQTRDFIYVADVVRCFLLAMERLERQPGSAFDVYNVCRGEGVSVNGLAGLVRAASNADLHISHLPTRPTDIRVSVGNPARARRDLGFVAATGLDDGLAATIAWARADAQAS